MNNLTFLRTRWGKAKRGVLSLLLFISLAVVLRSLMWWYQAYERGLGTHMAQVALSFHMMLVMGFMSVGLGIGHTVNWMIRKRRGLFRSPREGGKTETFIKVWGYDDEELSEMVSPDDTFPKPVPVMEIRASVEIPTMPRRGRKPAFTVDRWVPIAMKWEFRDPIRDSFTLGDLIAEHLGTNDDGSPIISEQTYYSVWKDRALEEIQRIEAKKKVVASSYKRRE